MAGNPFHPVDVPVLRGPCLDELVTFDTSCKDGIALVWDHGVGLPACWTYGEVHSYASRLSGQLSQLRVRREEGRRGEGDREDTGMVKPLPYIGVYAESSPELPALMLGILQSQCVFVPIPISGCGTLRSVIKMGVVHVLVHLDVVDTFLSWPEVWHIVKHETGCAIDMGWIEYGFVMFVLPNEKKMELSEEESLKADQSCTRERLTADSCNSVPRCEDLGDVPVIKAVVYARSHPLKSASIAYVMHTSGTTGASTPVHVPHCCITPNVLDLRRRFAISRDDVVFNAAPVTFDPAMVEIFSALSCGATLLMVPEHVKRSPQLLSKVLFKRNMTTVLQITPSLAVLLGDHVLSDDVLGKKSHVKVLAFGGEKCPGCKRIAKWKHPQNSTRVFNLYGITEVSSWASCCEVTEEDLAHWKYVPSSPGSQMCADGLSSDAVCIGGPLLSTRVEVVGVDGGRLSAEQPGEGEIWLGGRGRVCLVGNEEEAGLDVMRPSGDVGVVDEKGRVYCLGRWDFQVKRFGHRVSLEVLEQAILFVLDPPVSACVLAEVETISVPSSLPRNRSKPQDSPEHPRVLVLFVEPGRQCHIGNALDWTLEIQQQLSSTLSSHTIPDHVVIIGEIPITSHGKVDRGRLVQNWLRDRAASQQETMSSSYGQVVQALQLLAETHFQIKWELDQMLTIDCGLDSFSVLRLSNMIRDRFPILDRLHEGVALLDELLSGDLQTVIKYLVPLVSQVEKTTGTTLLTDEGETMHNPPLKEKDETVHTSSFKEVEGSSQPSLVVQGEESFSTVLADLSGGLEDKATSPPPAKKCKHTGLCGMKDGSASRACGAVFHCWRRGQYFCGNSLQVPLFYGLSHKPSRDTCLHLQVKWSVDTGKCIDASPLVVQFPSSLPPHTPCCVVYIGSHSGQFLAINWESGLVLWRALLGDRIESSATISACGGYVAVGCYDGNLYVLDAQSGSLYWKCQLSKEQPIKSSPCVDMATGLIWCGSHDQHLYALNVEERTVVHRLHLGGGSCFSSVCLDHQLRTLHIATLSGTVVAVDSDSGSVRWKHSCPKPVFSSPALLLSHDVTFGSVDGMCYVLSSQGELVGSMETLKPIFSSICAVCLEEDSTRGQPPTHRPLSLLLFGSHDHKLYCCCVTACSKQHKALETLWTFTTESPVYATPCVSVVGGTVCVCCVCSTGLLHLLELSSGAVLDSVRLPGEVFSSPVVREGCIVVGCRDDKVYAVDITS